MCARGYSLVLSVFVSPPYFLRQPPSIWNPLGSYADAVDVHCLLVALMGVLGTQQASAIAAVS